MNLGILTDGGLMKRMYLIALLTLTPCHTQSNYIKGALIVGTAITIGYCTNKAMKTAEKTIKDISNGISDTVQTSAKSLILASVVYTTWKASAWWHTRI